VKKIIIAVDGYSSCGKSTLARELANKLGYTYIDTGAMYRAVSLYLLENHINADKKDDVLNALRDIYIEFRINPANGKQETYLNEGNVEKEIRTLAVSKVVSPLSAIPEIRDAMVKQQQELGKGRGVVLDGRDIGTVVFPNAELKLFMTASPRIRAQRRYQELVAKGEDVSFDEVYQNVLQRDLIDTTRKVAPLIQAQDAVVIDNSDMSRDEQFEFAYNLAVKQLNQSAG
jgi:cytidylate kinase